MRFGINTLDDIDVQGKTVLCRIDINQPVDKASNTLKDTTRIEACIPTLRELSGKGAKLVLLAHQGSDIEYGNFWTTEPHALVLSNLLGREVQFIDDVCGPAARQAIRALKPAEILLLDNVRFVSEEQTLFETNIQLSHQEQTKTLLIRKLAPLADVYVCDAFAAAHRDQPSLCAFEQILPSAMGRLFEEEFCVITQIMEQPEKPCVFVLGGTKINDAFLMMQTMLNQPAVDTILCGGLVGQVLAWAGGIDIGELSRVFIQKEGYAGHVTTAKELLTEYRHKIILPCDFAVMENGRRKEYTAEDIPAQACIVDIGVQTGRRFQEIIFGAKTVFANGPMGIFEDEASDTGTKMVWNALGDTAAYTVIGGGDSIAAAKKFGRAKDMQYICTGGGALIRFLTGQELPVIKALKIGSQIHRRKEW